MRGIPRWIKNARNAQTRRSTALQAQSRKITTCVIANCFAGHINHLQEYDTIVCGKCQFAAEDISRPSQKTAYCCPFSVVNFGVHSTDRIIHANYGNAIFYHIKTLSS